MSRSGDMPPGYEFVRHLGSGGFGEVNLAEQVSLGRLVAIKHIHAYVLTDDDSLARFRREARTLAAMNHPAVVKVYDFQTGRGDATLIMEYVPGLSLADRLEAGPLSIPAAMAVLSDVAAALSAAAAQGVAHRDVKPGNVFVLPTGRAKLGDFGLARVVSDASVFRTQDGRETGTPAYFPPELSQGLVEPSATTDAYSFAVMAYEVLTGRQPFTGAGPIAIIAAHWTEQPPDPRELISGFPEVAARALLAGLDKSPGARPMPTELVHRIASVPLDAWPAAVTRTRPSGAEAVPRAAATIHVSDPLPSPGVPVAHGANRRPRRGVLLAGGIAVAVAVAALAVRLLAAGPGAPLAVEHVTLRADPESGVGRCPDARFEVTAAIATNGSPGVLEWQWTQPDGRTSEVQHVEVLAGQQVVSAQLKFEVRGARPLHGQAVLNVLMPAHVSSVGLDVTYVCAGAVAGS